MFFKSKHQKELEQEIKRCEEVIAGNGMAAKILASGKLKEFRQALESDMGGLEGYLEKPNDEQLAYMRLYGPIMDKAKLEQNEEEFFSAYLFMLFLNGAGSGYRSTVNQAIDAMQRINNVMS